MIKKYGIAILATEYYNYKEDFKYRTAECIIYMYTQTLISCRMLCLFSPFQFKKTNLSTL